jgi:anti-sigma factor RsiW
MPQSHGLNIVHWVADGYGFMVIGDVPEADLDRIAQTFQAQFS